MRIMLKLLTLSMTPVTNSTGTNNWLLKFGPRLSGENFLAQKSVASTMYETWSCSLPPANEVCEGYVFTGVCLSTREGSASGGSASRRGVCIQGGLGRPPPSDTVDTVNGRAVHILLECILVDNMLFVHA